MVLLTDYALHKDTIRGFICSFQYMIAPHTQAPYSHLSTTSSNARHRTMLCSPIKQADHTCTAQASQLHIFVCVCVVCGCHWVSHTVHLLSESTYSWPGVRYFWLVDDELKSMNMSKSQRDVMIWLSHKWSGSKLFACLSECIFMTNLQ